MNKKKTEKVTIPKSYQEDTEQQETINLCQSQQNKLDNNQTVNKSKNMNTIMEPSVLSCVDIDFDETECSNVLESTQALTHNHSISETNTNYTPFQQFKNDSISQSHRDTSKLSSDQGDQGDQDLSSRDAETDNGGSNINLKNINTPNSTFKSEQEEVETNFSPVSKTETNYSSIDHIKAESLLNDLLKEKERITSDTTLDKKKKKNLMKKLRKKLKKASNLMNNESICDTDNQEDPEDDTEQ
jgi:hypothetical protein